jgi:signal transduction histidine kinase
VSSSAPAAIKRLRRWSRLKDLHISRLAEFATVDELTKQIGHAVEDWPLVIAKELIDNAVDEAEEAGVPPQIEVVVEPSCITVADRGRGIPPETVEKLVLGDESTPSSAACASGLIHTIS